jgi:hypothetical protein
LYFKVLSNEPYNAHWLQIEHTIIGFGLSLKSEALEGANPGLINL